MTAPTSDSQEQTGQTSSMIASLLVFEVMIAKLDF